MANREEKTEGLTIVIGTLNRPEVILKLIKELLLQSSILPFEVLVFDQSSEGDYEKLKGEFPDKDNFKLLRLNSPNTCKYLNMGWQKAKYPIVLYLDDDVSITDKTLRAHINPYNDPRIMAVAGRVINDNEPVTSESEVGRIKWYGAIITKNFSYIKNCYADYPYGCNMSYRKEVLQKIGGFDEKLKPPIYSYCEVDTGYRVSSKWKNSFLFNPEALVYHHRFPRGGTRHYSKNEVEKSTQVNYGYFLGKNFNALQNTICFSRRLLFQLLKEPQAMFDIAAGFIFAKKNK